MQKKCKNLEIVPDRHLPNHPLFYCKLLIKGKVNQEFLSIQQRYKEHNPNSSVAPNGECPWKRPEECVNCPMYE